MRRLRELTRERHGLEMTPMIDVTFLLLIFFMCTLRFKTLEGTLGAHLPSDVGPNTSPAEPPPEPVEITVTVLEAGTRLSPMGEPWSGDPERRYVYGPDRVLQYRVGPWRTEDLAALERHARARREAKEPLQTEPVRATVDPRSGTVHEDVMAVLDRLASAGFAHVAFVGAEPD